MAVIIKSQREIELMRESCRILAQVHRQLGEAIKPGISTWDIDALGEKLIRSYGCILRKKPVSSILLSFNTDFDAII